MTFEISKEPFAWIVAIINLTTLLVTLGGAAFLTFKKKDKAWLPILLAILVVYGMSYFSRIRNGLIPAVPYSRITIIESSTGPIPHVANTHAVDILALGLALAAVIAMKLKK